jgi:glycosyltransferase involved in cell wall biosynthesis
MKKRIAILAHNIRAIDNPNGYRLQQYFPFFEQRGFDVVHITTGVPVPALVRTLRTCDIVYVQRLLPGPVKRYLLKTFAKKIVFDLDDAIMYGTRKESTTRRRRFAAMVRLADAVFCGNRFLMEEAGRYRTTGIHYVPTVVDTAGYPVKDDTGAGPCVVGWIGSASTLRYLADVAALFTSGALRAPLKVVADKPPDMPDGSVIFERWSGEREKELLLSFDIGLMPVRDDIWSRGKCGLKLIQYGASGLPSVSHPIGVSGDIIEDGENGFLRRDAEGWREAIERLIADAALRRRMGKKARAVVEERYSLAAWGPRVADLVDGL